jgi:hypothetical protein
VTCVEIYHHTPLRIQHAVLCTILYLQMWLEVIELGLQERGYQILPIHTTIDLPAHEEG